MFDDRDSLYTWKRVFNLEICKECPMRDKSIFYSMDFSELVQIQQDLPSKQKLQYKLLVFLLQR